MPRNITTSSTPSQRSAPDLELPCASRDAAERKRVLNVLAQQRYRRRKKEHLQRLELNLKTKSALEGTVQNPGCMSSASKSGAPENEAIRIAAGGNHREYQLAGLDSSDDLGPLENGTGLESLEGEGSQSFPPSHRSTATFVNPADILSTPPMRAMDVGMPLEASPNSNQCLQFSWDPQLPFSPLTGSSQPSSLASTSTLKSKASETISADNTSPTWHTSSSSTSTTQTQDPSVSARASISNIMAKTTTSTAPLLADAAQLPLLELTFLKGCIAVAERMQFTEVVWDLSALSPFYCPTFSGATGSYAHLPPHLRPTPAQLQIPHHPLLDLLPWPEVRQKLIVVLAQPEKVLPPAARGPPHMALMSLVTDVEDGAEGVRVWGDDPFELGNWEIGERVFRRWWWAFDCDILRRSNAWRTRRGAPPLGSGEIIGDLS